MSIRPEFTVHRLNAAGLSFAEQVAQVMSRTLNELETLCGAGSREMAIVRTKLQEASFFAKRAVAERPEFQEHSG